MMKKVRVIIADDNPNFIEGLQVILSMTDKYEIVAVYENGKQLAESNRLHEVDIILSDIEMPEMDGIEAATSINFQYPKLRMIAITMHMDKVFLSDIVSAGFKGFVYKPDTAKNLLKVMEQVLNNDFSFPDNIKVSSD